MRFFQEACSAFSFLSILKKRVLAKSVLEIPMGKKALFWEKWSKMAKIGHFGQNGHFERYPKCVKMGRVCHFWPFFDHFFWYLPKLANLLLGLIVEISKPEKKGVPLFFQKMMHFFAPKISFLKNRVFLAIFANFRCFKAERF